MTTRLYYTDPLLASFEAVVTSAIPDGDGVRVVLDRTAFYPTSGGQPHDTGRLGGLPVIDVIDREDGEVEHRVEGRLEPGRTVAGEIDWTRRFDHMQQHTGQHVLSAAFERTAAAGTVSFHLGRERSTIDLHREVSAQEIGEAEALASRVVWEGRPVAVRFATGAEAAGLALRKDPSRSGELRLIEIRDFDLSACGGTHVTDTARIGVIAVFGWERFKGGSRVSFVCGGRALASHGRLRDIVAEAGRVLSVGADEIAPAIARLRLDVRDQARTMTRLHEELVSYRAADVRKSAETIGPYRVVLRSDVDAEAQALRALAAAVVAAPGLVVVLIGAGEPAPVVVARSEDVAFDAGRVLREMAAALGGRGGGRPELAQGGVAADPARIMAFVRTTLDASG
jgi:alanyl-tRNA synthetase